MANTSLKKATAKKFDEFYTQISDIERELKHYWPGNHNADRQDLITMIVCKEWNEQTDGHWAQAHRKKGGVSLSEWKNGLMV